MARSKRTKKRAATKRKDRPRRRTPAVEYPRGIRAATLSPNDKRAVVKAAKLQSSQAAERQELLRQVDWILQELPVDRDGNHPLVHQPTRGEQFASLDALVRAIEAFGRAVQQVELTGARALVHRGFNGETTSAIAADVIHRYRGGRRRKPPAVPRSDCILDVQVLDELLTKLHAIAAERRLEVEPKRGDARRGDTAIVEYVAGLLADVFDRFNPKCRAAQRRNFVGTVLRLAASVQPTKKDLVSWTKAYPKTRSGDRVRARIAAAQTAAEAWEQFSQDLAIATAFGDFMGEAPTTGGSLFEE